MNYLIVGLGNPGEKYINTRHNLGFMIIDYFSSVEEINFQKKKEDLIAHKKLFNKEVYILKPGTFMNLSGSSLVFWMKNLSIKKENLLVVYDDLDLPLGKIKIKSEGSSAGHNGIKDISEKLQTENFPRMRIGIGRNYSAGEQSNYVLSNFSSEEFLIIKDKAKIICEAIKTFIKEGITKTMNTYNKKLYDK